MSNGSCMNNSWIILIIILLVVSFGAFVYLQFNNFEFFRNNHINPNYADSNCPTCPSCPEVKCPPCNCQIKSVTNETIIDEIETTRNDDVIRDYDYKKMFDPLESPTRRIPRNSIPPSFLKNMIDIPTRGLADNFNQLGILIKKGGGNTNRILRLFGRPEFFGSNRYEYYTSISNGLDQIKLPINLKRQKELDDRDIIFIKDLDEHYEVKLHKYDSPRYYPNLL